jgi:hypothetical protein
MTKKTTYKIIFMQLGEIYEVFAKQIYQSDMYGFIEVEDFIFGEKAQMIVDPAEEKLKTEFADVKRSYIPMHTLLRIDEVEKEGSGKIREVKSGDKVTAFPVGGSRPQIGPPFFILSTIAYLLEV